MEKELILIIIFGISFSIISFFIGYILGKLNNINGVYDNRPKSFFEKEKQSTAIKNEKIQIDDTKFVLDIKTDQLEKKYESLGEIKKSEEKITESIDKLKKLKR